MDFEGYVISDKYEHRPDYLKMKSRWEIPQHYTEETDWDVNFNGKDGYIMDEGGTIRDTGTKIVADPDEYTWLGGNKFR